ncbi:hypothetical protein RM553_10790 [Zunongwangia sp. F363]|uniref:Uncharacterized protein n=1 Tax=Autumnicola tepida TaxID=3075595 RepID=A0ABU3CAF5_9FLAO|nr:hypothetical protein [Zunongwangia sp. F363]MDT0643316.1 hypothetical protein [Zunongwangia sp. F363]
MAKKYKTNHQLIIGDKFEDIVLETFRDIGTTRPRVRPVENFDPNIRVEFPVHLREENPVGTRFKANVKVSQKTREGEPFGPPYLVADVNSIEQLT